MVQKLLNLKQKVSEIVATPLCLERLSKGFSVDNMKKTGLNYNDTPVDDIHKYLMKKMG